MAAASTIVISISANRNAGKLMGVFDILDHRRRHKKVIRVTKNQSVIKRILYGAERFARKTIIIPSKTRNNGARKNGAGDMT